MPRVDVSMTSAEIAEFLVPARTAIFTTLGREGWPHSVGMWFVPDGDELRMWAYAKSQKVRNLERDPRAAFIVEEGTSYDTLRGVMVQGSARLVSDVEEIFDIGRRLYERYTLPITGVPVDQGPEVEIRRQAGKRLGVALPMERVASWDHSKIAENGGGSN